ncbi:hypothetical protein RJ639_017852 [Escallonia herrerae]|uniref:AP-3 complex subunit beta n=1 Tax=Escallonia herrerae TaxID=1293975 RepID=A0AA89AK95_9ASTE|nr:hypothetical protein RJ639_017852 [Escallonia herrerae]
MTSQQKCHQYSLEKVHAPFVLLPPSPKFQQRLTAILLNHLRSLHSDSPRPAIFDHRYEVQEMFPQFGATAESLSKASSAVLRIGTDAHLYDDPEDVSIPPLLDSRFDSDKCEALKRLLALIAQGFDVSNFFPQVVKNVASQSLEVKKLVYLYLLHYAEKRPNEALLSINCFQKDLGDPNPLVRAWALRAMAGIRLHVIAPLVLVAVGKCARDPSVYVRKCAANALPKLHDLRLEEITPAIEEVVGTLLNDNSPGVVGAAAAAFASVCPNNLALVGGNYKKLCETLPDVEEWGQILLIEILLRYVIARNGLVKESIMSSYSPENYNSGNDDTYTNFDLKEKQMTCYADSGSLQFDSSQFTSAKSDDDVKMLLQCTSPLLWSHNSAVVLAAAGVLCNIQVFAKAMPSLFAPHFEDFFISSSDTYQIKALKLEILSSIATDSSISAIFQEFQDYVRDPDRTFAADTVAAIGLCARQLPNLASTCLEGLLALTTPKSLNTEYGYGEGEAIVLIQAMMSIKAIIKLDPPSHEKVIIHLVRSLESIKVPAARSLVIWMVGEYNSIGHIIPKMLPTTLKYLAWCFSSEALETKLQILNATVKVLLCAKGEDLSTFKSILSYVLELARSDLNYDIRDRARVFMKLLSCYICSHGAEGEEKHQPNEKDLPRLLAECIFRGQTKAMSPEPVSYRFYLPGSLSLIVFHAAPGYDPLPEPCSLTYNDNGPYLNTAEGDSSRDSYKVEDLDTMSRSMDEESTCSDGSQDSATGSSGSGMSGSASGGEDNTGSFINFSDVAKSNKNQNGGSDENDARFGVNDLGELMSKSALESWLDEKPDSSHSLPEESDVRRSLARISIGDIAGRVKPKTYALLDPANGNGLKVDYTFLSEISSVSPLLICVEVTFTNCSTEAISELNLSNVDDNSVDSSDRALTTER